MKWINHIAIAAATTAVISPPLVPVAVLGSTAPDWLEWTPRLIGKRSPKHRTVTHYVIFWVLALLFGLFVWDFHHVITAFAAGGLSHVLCDACTAHGVPLGWWSDRRFHLFGGRLKTGLMGEYWVAGCIVVVCIAIGWATKSWGGEFVPFFYDYAGMYDSGVIDAKEWRDNRFRFF